MWPLINPNISALETFQTCISRIKNKAFKIRLESIEDDIDSAAIEYIDAAENGMLHTIVAEDNIQGIVSNAEMMKIYTGRLVPEKSPGRLIYQTILSVPKHKTCPYCGHRKVSTLDHILSKSFFSTLTVNPQNLVACCFDCNKIKPTVVPAAAENVFIHPYFDDVSDERWLFASFAAANSASLIFFVNPVAAWTNILQARVENHFSELELNSLYQSNAAEELVSIRYRLEELYASGGRDAVKSHLVDEYASRLHARINSWETATYMCFSMSDWFCDGGFLSD